MSVKKIINRIYSDYFMPSRLGELERIYDLAVSHDYEFCSVIDFWSVLKKGIDPKKKYFISRHDVDTDVDTARRIFEMEERLGVRASYYFRISTLNFDFMRQIENGGGEASYHFEEIATLAKFHKWKKHVDINFELARHTFRENYLKIKEKTGLQMRSICSHGDFANRKLGVPNHCLLDEDLKNSLGIELETYDHEFMRHITSRHSDTDYPEFYRPSSPVKSIAAGERVIYFLTHPRRWRSDFWVNTKDNITRVAEGLNYRFG